MSPRHMRPATNQGTLGRVRMRSVDCCGCLKAEHSSRRFVGRPWNTDRRAGRITSSAFVGRSDELRDLLEIFGATQTAPAVVLLGGEAGVGTDLV